MEVKAEAYTGTSQDTKNDEDKKWNRMLEIQV
jgi:hypothetical protein